MILASLGQGCGMKGLSNRDGAQTQLLCRGRLSALRLHAVPASNRRGFNCCSSSSRRKISVASADRTVIAFTEQQLKQPFPPTSTTTDSDSTHASSNRRDYHPVHVNGHGNGHAKNGYSNGSNGHSNGNGSGHANGNGKGAAATAVSSNSTSEVATASAATPSATAALSDADSAQLAPADAPAAVADVAAAAAEAPVAVADVAAAAWAACAASLQLPGQQLSATTYDCGVSVTISRDAPESHSPSSSLSSLSSSDSDDGSAASAAAADTGCYYVRVVAPGHFGSDCVLHWAVENWQMPAKACQPPHSEQHGDRAVRTPFSPLGYMPAVPTAATAPEAAEGSQHADSAATGEVATAAPVEPRPLYESVPDGTPWCVTLVFPDSICPERLVFVVHQRDEDAWVRDHGANFSLQLRSPCLNDLVEGVMAAEASYEHWGLLHRLQRVLEALDNAEAAGAAGMAFMFTWLRLSSSKLLDWQRCFSYQPRDITWAQQQVAERIAEKARTAPDPAVRMYCRMTLSKLSRGGGNGDEIRMGILNIMRDHGIKEGNRGGLDEPFLEQWHQKLHQATSPEDVIVAEAYLAFLYSGNHEDWWRVLAEKGLSKEQIESWEQPITALPMHLPQLIPAIQHYHWVLKTCHSGAELDTALTCAQGFVDPDLRWHLYDLLANRNAWWAPGKTLELRRRLKPYWQAPGSSRDLLLLDIALESWLRMLIERQDKRALSGDDLVELVGLVLGNAALTGTSAELELVSAQWEAVRTHTDRWSRAWCLAASAALGRVTLALSAFADEICSQVQPYAELFGLRCGVPTAHILNFSEEVVRDQALFVGSLLAAELEPRLRTAAGASSWQVVSQVQNATGQVVLLPDLLGVQGVAFETPTVVLAQALGGMEDIPDGVVALLTRSSTDVLSHVAIRARTQGVLLAGCSDEEEWRHLVELEGQQTSLAVASSGDVIAGPPDNTANSAGAITQDLNPEPSPDGLSPKTLPELSGSNWRVTAAAQGSAFLGVLQEDEFTPDVVGAKACNLAKLREKLPEWILVPRSVALPFGTFEAVLAHPANAEVAAEIAVIEQQLAAADKGCKGVGRSGVTGNGAPRTQGNSASDASASAASPVVLLARARELVEKQLKPPARMQQIVHTALTKAGLLEGSSSSSTTSSSSTAESMDVTIEASMSEAGTTKAAAASAGLASSSRDQHQQQLALPVNVGSGPAWDPENPECPAWVACWSAICGVWASKWNHRAWLSRRSAGLTDDQLAVSVLIQQVLPGQYAFVLHTASPFSGARGEMYGEMVCGLGETLVGNHPGRPLAFSDRPDGSDMQLLALPSKRQVLLAPASGTLIARSDTNGEDLAGYAGAGLYDSIPVTPLEPCFPDYANERIMWDAAFRQQLLDGLVELGYAVESAFDDTPQDIEGVWLAGRFAVVQSRPQVMAHCATANGQSNGTASSAGRQRAKALAAAEAAEAAAAVAAVREAGPGTTSGLGMGGSGEWEYEW